MINISPRDRASFKKWICPLWIRSKQPLVKPIFFLILQFLMTKFKKSLEIGSASAAIVVTKVGCSHAMPSFEDINKFMYKNKMLN